jgi:biotin transport system substrate-specific component
MPPAHRSALSTRSGLRGAARSVRAIPLALLGSTLLTLSAKLQVPFYPVPMTMQALVVLLLGLAFGAALGAAAMVRRRLKV